MISELNKRSWVRSRASAIGVLVILLPSVFAATVLAQQAQKWKAEQWRSPEPLTDDSTGFEAIFDGKTLDGWDGDPAFWRVENGSLVGETTPATILDSNSYAIWRGGRVADFELKVEYRINPTGNSGINYRSAEVPDAKWAMRGYQADIDGPDWAQGIRWPGTDRYRATGQNYEERGRQILALPGQLVYVGEGRYPRVFASTGSIAPLEQTSKEAGWNSYHLVVRGNVMIHIVNGRAMSLVIDDDVENRHLDGELGLQLHKGRPMKVEFRDIRLKIF